MRRLASLLFLHLLLVAGPSVLLLAGPSVLLLAGLPAGAEELRPAGEGRVVEVIDGDTVRLASGEQVRLVGIQAPKLALGRANFDPWPLAPEAKAALEALVLDRRVRLSHGGRERDRHGRLLAHLHLADGRWVQGALLEAGFARVYSFRDNRARVFEMLALEAEARTAGRGIWGEPFYRVLTPLEAEGPIGSFQIVEGRVVAAAIVKRRGYLNFGVDWRDDFTISIAGRDLRLFEKAGIAIADYQGRRVRVRGWLESFNGPMIEVTHPEQIELLE